MPRRIRSALRERAQRARDLAAIRELGPETLRDIGMTRAELEWCCTRGGGIEDATRRHRQAPLHRSSW